MIGMLVLAFGAILHLPFMHSLLRSVIVKIFCFWGNSQTQSQRNQTLSQTQQRTNQGIVKKHDTNKNNTKTVISMQYSNNMADSTSQNEDTVEEVHTQDMDINDDQTILLEFINYHKINLLTTHKAHIEYWVVLAHVAEDLCIPDVGADSHVRGRTWLPLCGLTGPKTKYANVTGFDENLAKKSGLPIISAVTKTINPKGEEIFLRAKHLIYNHTSKHTLLSTYHMREIGHIVDDVSKNVT